jgi:hypothetical protein
VIVFRQVIQLINKTSVGSISLYALATIGMVLFVVLMGGVTLLSLFCAVVACIWVSATLTPWLLFITVPVLIIVLIPANVWFWQMLMRRVFRPSNDYLDW